MYIEVKNKDHLIGLIKNNKLVIVDFWADWCGPCKKIGAFFKQNLEPWLDEHEGYILAKINTDENKELSEIYNVNAIPTIMIFANNQQIVWMQENKKIDRIRGFNPNVIQFIKEVAHDCIA